MSRKLEKGLKMWIVKYKKIMDKKQEIKTVNIYGDASDIINWANANNAILTGAPHRVPHNRDNSEVTA